jgi:YidC/Oxa1 family membrane protein insertase
METKRAVTAVILSLIILIGYQYFFLPATPEVPPATVQSEPTAEEARVEPPAANPAVAPIPASAETEQARSTPLTGKDIPVETALYSAVVSENGGGIKSMRLKSYRETLGPEAPLKELVFTQGPSHQPLLFAWGNGMPAAPEQYTASPAQVTTPAGAKATLTMTAQPMPGLNITRNMTFADNSYQILLEVVVKNNTAQALQGAPFLASTNKPFTQGEKSSQGVFNGPAVYLDGALQEVKVDKLKSEGAKTLTGQLSWTAYEDSYFLCGIIPQQGGKSTVQFTESGENQVTSTVSGEQEVIPPGGEKRYQYTVFMGPKKLSILQEVGSDLDKIINFGWFDVLAKPTLFLLNFLYRYLHNYGVAIILVTILFKLLFWPISHKGMKSMKTMQKIQPKMAKLREKYKDDHERLNQEMMTLYKTYKINPLGGCLPMILQIPVFFALYKVLLQTIELRHAPFMLWITDLSAPDRLGIGIDIPGLGGIPVLTLLMGASMFLQQKMSPTTGDPTQAKVMMFLPVIFTFMFLNFASGLVLYWFLNNLLSIGQQYMINRSVEP